MDKYILKDKKIVPVDLMTWTRWFETANRHVAKTTLKDGKWISTVFLGLDHNFGVGKPLLFETMVFKSKDNFNELDIARYSTWEEAEKGHQRMVNKWKND